MTTKAIFKPVTIPVTFGNFTKGDEKMSITFHTAHESLVEDASTREDRANAVKRFYELFCSRTLGITLKLGRREMDDPQGALIETGIVFDTTFDSSMSTPSRKACGGKLSMQIDGDNWMELAAFAYQEGLLRINTEMEEIDVDAMNAARSAENDANRPMLPDDETNGENENEEDDSEHAQGGTATKAKTKAK